MKILKISGMLVLFLLAGLLLLSLFPVSTKGLTSKPNPTNSYDEAVMRFDAISAAEEPIVNEYGSSLLMTHGDKTDEVYVIAHGLTNSPYQFEEFGNMLYDRGHNVLILRMPDHGLKSHRVSELKNLKPAELPVYADEAVDIAVGLGDKINVLGLSGGGAVTGWIAQNREVDQALLLSPFLGVKAAPSFATPFLTNLFSRLPNVVLDNPAEPRRDWGYRGEATRGVVAYLTLGKALTEEAEAAAPAAEEIIIVTTAVDDTADNTATAKLASIWEEDGANVITYEFEPALDIPHNSVDPAADPAKKAIVYAKMLEMLSE